MAILGVIATFSIPKVLQTQQSSQKKAIAKEAAATLSAAYDAFKSKNVPKATTTFQDLVPYLNYVKIDTSSTIDNDDLAPTTYDCTPTKPCYVLHNGAFISADLATCDFAGTTNLNSIFLYVDPDGKYTGDRAVTFFLYFDGRITSGQYTLPGTTNGNGWSGGLADPAWFSWN